jgi:hypothetical protein
VGVVTGLLLLPITGPLVAFRFLLERMRDEAEAVLRDEGRAFAELIDLSMRRNSGQLSEADYVQQEAELLERLNSIREYRNELLNTEMDEEDWEYDDEMQEDDAEWQYADVDEDEENW